MATDREAQLVLIAYQAEITSPNELAIFMAQVSHESGGLNQLNEGFRYTRGINQITRDAGVTSALREGPEVLEAARLEALRGNPEGLAELMYGGRMGNHEPGDGYKYHGRGYIQLTGNSQYQAAEQALDLGLINNPELAAEPENAAKIAVWFWKTRVPQDAREDITRAGGAINRGNPDLSPNHPEARRIQYEKWQNALTPDVMEKLSRGEVALPITHRHRAASDPTVAKIQQNLNTIGITDARGQPLVVDGQRGGPASRTNEAIAAFQQRFGLDGERSNAALLSATQVALTSNPAHSFEQSMRGILPEAPPPPRMVNGMPDYLLPGRSAAGQTSPAPQGPQQAEPATPRPLPTTQTLEPGDRGAAVLALQQHLRLVGAQDAQGREIEPDRDYGARTREAVEQFQLWTGRETTGIADPDTLDALQSHAQFAARQRTQAIAPGAHLIDHLQPTVPNLADAADPRSMQERNAVQDPAAFERGRSIATAQSGLIQLGYHHRISQPLQVNGTLDDATRQAVTAFQAQQNLPITSSIDLATQQALQQALLAQQAAAHKHTEDQREEERRAEPAQVDERKPAFSHKDHPQHALYADLDQRFQAKGQALSEEQLSVLTARMVDAGFKPGWQGDVMVRGERAFVGTGQVGEHAYVDLKTPAPAVETTMQEFAVQQQQTQQRAEEIARLLDGPEGPTRGGPGRSM